MFMRYRLERIKEVMLGLVLPALLAMPAIAQSFNVVDMGVLRGGSARVHGINAAGMAVGGSGFVYGANRHAYLWQGDQMRDLGLLTGGDFSEAFGINDSGQVVGSSNTSDSMRAFIWSSSGGLQWLPMLPGTNASQAYAINAAGQIAGVSGMHAAVWGKGAVQDLGALPGANWSEAHGLNNLGQVVGSSTTTDGPRAVLWSHGAMQNLGTLSGDESSRANFINDQGMIVGASSGNGRRARFSLDDQLRHAAVGNTLRRHLQRSLWA